MNYFVLESLNDSLSRAYEEHFEYYVDDKDVNAG